MNGHGSTFEDERVTFIANPDHPERFLPQISAPGHIREFEPEDMGRVLDWDGVGDPPGDGALMHCEDAGAEGIQFPRRHFCLRGGYLFYFDIEDVDEDSGPVTIFHSPPLGVIPLEKIIAEFPPGGRRVFREHAHTEARTGYEFVILHVPGDEDGGQMRPPAFIATESMGQREKWAKALRERAGITKPTLLRTGYSTSLSKKQNAMRLAEDDDLDATATATMASVAATAVSGAGDTKERRKSMAAGGRRSTRMNERLEPKDDSELTHALHEFGAANFNEKDWIDNFFQIHNDFDAPSKIRQMEQHQTEIKRNLKGAVLEQYEYFVQASGEMTTMGREVSSLRNLIETQLETIKEMKEIDFKTGINKAILDDKVEDDDEEAELPRLDKLRTDVDTKESFISDDQSVFSEMSSILYGRNNKNKTTTATEEATEDQTEEDAPPIEIPDWLEDTVMEISSIAREGRYSDAVDLHTKAKNEIADLFEKHERPTPYRLAKDKLTELRKLQRRLDAVGKKIGGNIEETLRRKNEALRQATKRERSDPNATITSVSPCSLNDDATYLQLLVKLGKTQVAAEAYAARRSLLLLEALNERPISGAGAVDLVIYSAQLSQSFFSCLANSVEGFLDLFLLSSGSSPNGEKNGDNDSIADSSLHSQTMKQLPAGAVASVVLWCDSELAKFAGAFGGTRILANIALSPPPRDGPKKPRVVGETSGYEGSKERKNAIEVAAQCIDQAFLYAAQNLDSVGLPLAPRLAEYIRVRLKGCEAEISLLLDERWQHLTAGWRNPAATNGAHSRMAF